ncbi:MAG: FapA family protein [Chitinispirillia bacterium]|nr:FapA family protein [Chitinispirillia bacterium]MCL2241897.1 FapA family protein [Chitinispirillia bacterium]
MAEGTNNASGAGRSMPDFVSIDVRVAMDRMSARLYLRPHPVLTGTLTVEHLRAALEREEIARGIDSGALKSAADDWNRNPREVETPPVARGGGATTEKVGTLRISVKLLTAPLEVAQLLESRHYWQIAPLASKFQRVDQGTIVARRAAGAPSLLGYDIFGAPITPDVEGTGMPELASIAQVGNVFAAGNIYTSSVTGVAYLDGSEIPKVHAIIFDATAEVRAAPDRMSAELFVTPAGERGGTPAENSIRDQIKAAGITYGVDYDEMRFFLARFFKGNPATPQSIVIARGTPAVKGSDGRVDYCFNTDTSPAPLLNPDGSADYRNINIVTSVAAGTLLARLIPPTPGSTGKDITGRELTAPHGTPTKLPVGTNTMIPPADPATLIATANGIVNFDGAVVNISEGYMIPGNVDYSTGNVTYEGTVGVNGDVKSGFEVNCGGDLQINGTIEDAKVTVKGNVLCRYGFVGNGKGVIDAGGDVNLVYVKNQTVIAGGIVNVAREAINCNITAGKSIKIYGHNLSVAGGTLAAHESIILKTAGNISGVKTLIQIIPEPELVAQMASMRTMAAQHEDNIKKLALTLETLPPAKRQDKEFVRKLRNAIIMIKQEMLGLDEKMRALSVTMNNFSGSFIRVERCAYPGTIFSIGQRNMVLNEMLNSSKTLKLVDQDIKVL